MTQGRISPTPLLLYAGSLSHVTPKPQRFGEDVTEIRSSGEISRRGDGVGTRTSGFGLPVPKIASTDKRKLANSERTEDADAQTRSLSEEKVGQQHSLLEAMGPENIPDEPVSRVTSRMQVQHFGLKSPLHSIRVLPELLEGFHQMGYNEISHTQDVTLSTLISDPPQNLIVQSQSGSGKTAAFVLAMLCRIDTSQRYPQAICMCPTVDLALQTYEVLEQMGRFLPGFECTRSINGYKPVQGQMACEQVVVGTPGIVFDCIRKKVLDPSKIVMFVVDEADMMLSTQGYQDQTIQILKTLNSSCQLALFSTTWNEDVMNVAASIIPNLYQLKWEEQLPESIKQFYVRCPNEESKFEALANIYGTISIGQTMIFCQTRESATRLASKMVKEGHAVGLLTGEMDTKQRLAVLSDFKAGKKRILIATNVNIRGINIEQVTMVVNYDLPYDAGQPDFVTYLHRIGRAGRFGKPGLAVNLVNGQESHHKLLEIEKYFGRPIQELQVDDPDAIEKAVGED